MTSIYYFIDAATPQKLKSAPIFIVKVGESQRAINAHVAIAALAVSDNRYYYCVKSDESLFFVHNLRVQNPDRAIYQLDVSKMLAILNKTANVADVENLCDLIRANEDDIRRTMRGHENLFTLKIKKS